MQVKNNANFNMIHSELNIKIILLIYTSCVLNLFKKRRKPVLSFH